MGVQSARTPSSAPPPSTTSMSASSALLLPRRTAAPRRIASRSVCAYHSKARPRSRGCLCPCLLTYSCSLPPHSLRDRVRCPQAVAHPEINPPSTTPRFDEPPDPIPSPLASAFLSGSMQDFACKRLTYIDLCEEMGTYYLPMIDGESGALAGSLACLFRCGGWERQGLAHRALGNVSIGEAQRLRGSHADKNQRSPVYN